MKLAAVIGIVLLLFVLLGLPYGKVDATHQYISDQDWQEEVKICVLADLHCRRFGKGQSHILDQLAEEKPDAVVIPGDLFDIDRDYEICFELLNGISGIPVYFTSGNHDMYLREITELRQRMQSLGVHVVEDVSEILEVKGKKIRITGLTDHGRKPVYTPEEVKQMQSGEADYDIALYHRPNYTDYFRTLPVNLVISGHAHGGQWCFPFTTKGFFAPQEGFFPKHTAGLRKAGDVWCSVSRGLASGAPYLFRLYNNPEVVFIHIQ